jgi:hypothetical protein
MNSLLDEDRLNHDETNFPSTVCNYCNKMFSSSKKLQEHTKMRCKVKPLVDSGLLSFQGGSIPGKIRFSETEKDNIICKLLYDVALLKMELYKVNSNMNTIKRKQTLQIVKGLNNNPDFKPKYTIQQWLQTIPVSLSHVSHVFQKNMNEAIKQVLLDGLNMAENSNTKPPLMGFHEKPNKLYVYYQDMGSNNNHHDGDKSGKGSNKKSEITSKWVNCDYGMMRKWCSTLVTRFIQIFIDNEDYFLEPNLEDETKQEQKITNFNSIMSNSYKQGDFIENLTEHLYNRIKQKSPFDESRDVNDEN